MDGRGLERWEPTLKAGFPIGADGVRRVVDALRIDGLDVDQGGYTVDRIVDFLASSGSVRPVQVHKHRVRYTVGGCSAELSNVTADGRSIRTLAIESEDGAAVSAAVRSVGLAGYINTSYPRGLTALLDGVPPRYAVIDVGTNSVKFYVGERAADGKWRRVADRAEITRLGERLEEKGEITPEALERTIVAIAGMAEEAKRIGAVAIAAVGTAGLRAASNGADAVADILRRTGVHVEVITGQDEADWRSRPSGSSSTRRMPRSSSSIPAAAARSSRSGTGSTWTSGSVSRSVPPGSPNCSGWIARCHPTCSTRRARRSRSSWLGSTVGRHPTP